MFVEVNKLETIQKFKPTPSTKYFINDNNILIACNTINDVETYFELQIVEGQMTPTQCCGTKLKPLPSIPLPMDMRGD